MGSMKVPRSAGRDPAELIEFGRLEVRIGFQLGDIAVVTAKWDHPSTFRRIALVWRSTGWAHSDVREHFTSPRVLIL